MFETIPVSGYSARSRLHSWYKYCSRGLPLLKRLDFGRKHGTVFWGSPWLELLGMNASYFACYGNKLWNQSNEDNMIFFLLHRLGMFSLCVRLCNSFMLVEVSGLLQHMISTTCTFCIPSPVAILSLCDRTSLMVPDKSLALVMDKIRHKILHFDSCFLVSNTRLLITYIDIRKHIVRCRTIITLS